MSSRYTKTVTLKNPRGGPDATEEVINPIPIIRDASIVVSAFILLLIIWPFNSVPTGSRGVITQFGRIVGIEPEGLTLLWPWQKLTLFSIRAEAATIEDASGALYGTTPAGSGEGAGVIFKLVP